MLIHIKEVTLFMHILLGIVWLGGILFVGWGVYPTVNKMSLQIRRQFLYTMMKNIHQLLTIAGALVIVSGIILATILGPIKNASALFASAYGQLFMAAFILALFGLLWGTFISYRITMNMLQNETIWTRAENGETAPLQRKMRLVTMISAVEVICLMIVVWIMVLI